MRIAGLQGLVRQAKWGMTMKVYKHGIYDYITIVEIPKTKIKKIDFALCKQPKETLKSYYDRQSEKPDFLMNGGFFTMSNGKTCFNFIDEGADIVSGHWHELGMGIVDENTLVYGNINTRSDWRDFVAAYPTLIENGKAVPITYATEINYKARRSVLAYDNNHVLLIAIESPGMTFGEVQGVLLAMGVTHAINLDGGGSTKILQNGKSITSISYNRAVDNVVSVYLKKLYRVQVGAFSKMDYAISMLAEIRDLPDTVGAGYKNAYVRKIGNYWKVQVGAFSKVENAQKVLNDLNDKGLAAFITIE